MDIKFRYYSRYENSEAIAVDECTLEEIEDGYFKKPFIGGIIARVQYTGETDDDGVEIYQGDIVEVERKCDYHKAIPYKETVVIGDPIYEQLEGIQSGGPDEYHEVISIKVIGNIYENPEMMPNTENN